MKLILVFFLVVTMPIQWANAVLCGYCHLDPLNTDSTRQTQATSGHGHALAEPAAPVVGGPEETPSGASTSCDMCQVASNFGPLQLQDALLPSGACATRHAGLAISLQQAEQLPPEFVPI